MSIVINFSFYVLVLNLPPRVSLNSPETQIIRLVCRQVRGIVASIFFPFIQYFNYAFGERRSARAIQGMGLKMKKSEKIPRGKCTQNTQNLRTIVSSKERQPMERRKNNERMPLPSGNAPVPCMSTVSPYVCLCARTSTSADCIRYSISLFTQ